MLPHDENVLEPRSYPIPDELRQFLEVVDHFIEGIKQGTYRLDEEHTHLVDGDYLNWSFHSGISGVGIWGSPNEDLTAFEFRCSPPICGSEWHLEVNRIEIAQIASGDKTEVLLYACRHPLCGFRSSDRFRRCPHCELEIGVDVDSAGKDVRGLCPYCRKVLRSLSARQCPHCLMEWHDPEHPTRMGKPQS